MENTFANLRTADTAVDMWWRMQPTIYTPFVIKNEVHLCECVYFTLLTEIYAASADWDDILILFHLKVRLFMHFNEDTVYVSWFILSLFVFPCTCSSTAVQSGHVRLLCRYNTARKLQGGNPSPSLIPPDCYLFLSIVFPVTLPPALCLSSPSPPLFSFCRLQLQ